MGRVDRPSERPRAGDVRCATTAPGLRAGSLRHVRPHRWRGDRHTYVSMSLADGSTAYVLVPSRRISDLYLGIVGTLRDATASTEASKCAIVVLFSLR